MEREIRLKEGRGTGSLKEIIQKVFLLSFGIVRLGLYRKDLEVYLKGNTVRVR